MERIARPAICSYTSYVWQSSERKPVPATPGKQQSLADAASSN